MIRKHLIPLAAIAVILGSGPARATLDIETSLDSAIPIPGNTISVVMPTVTTPSQTDFSGIGFLVTFLHVPAAHGVVQGPLADKYAIPVAGQEQQQ